jgi:hypothetical protein
MRTAIGTALAALAVTLVGTPVMAQAPTGSIDFQGPSVGTPDGFSGVPITEGDILTTTLPGPPGPNPLLPGPLPPPGIEIGALPGAPGVIPGGLGIFPGLFGLVELDALSYGQDQGDQLLFSVDEFAAGVPGPAPPDVFTEGIAGAAEASADAFAFLGPVVPTPPGPVLGNSSAADGDGVPPSGLPGSGLVEPNPPTPGFTPDPGDNLDAFDADTLLAHLTGPIFFSLDAAFPDPVEGVPANSGTAVGNGASGADVLVSFAGGGPALAIPGPFLGLDLFGFDTDDLDALLFHDADGTLTLTPGDTLYFSVRRGSAIIGTPDSAFGVPIEEGDVLMPPAVAGTPPAIFIGAEALGLATLRSGTAGPFGADDLDALDIIVPPPPVIPTLTLWAWIALAALLLTTPIVAAAGSGRARVTEAPRL